MSVDIKFRFTAEADCPTTAPLGLGILLIDQFGKLWSPNGAGGHSRVPQMTANGSGLVDPSGAVIALSELLPGETHLAATATIACSELAGWECTVAAGNITIYFGTDTSGQLLKATQALVLGPMPIMGAGTNGRRQVPGGNIRVVLDNAAARVTVMAN